MFTVFTRKNFIFLALVAIFSFVTVYVGCCIDATHAIFNAKNLINMVALGMNMQPIEANIGGYVTLILVAFYLFIGAGALIYARRSCIVSGKNTRSTKMILIYVAIVVACLILSFGLGIAIQKPLNNEESGVSYGQSIVNMLTFVGQSLGLGALVWLIIFAVVGAISMLVVNFKKIGKPFNFFGKEETPDFDDDDVRDLDVESSFASKEETDENAVGGTGLGGLGGAGAGELGGDMVTKSLALDDRETVFPELSKIDAKYEAYDAKPMVSDEISLNDLCTQFRQFLCKKHNLYFDIDTIRFFISGFASSHFEILEGLSGTGKSSLPRYFAEFVNGKLLFMPVQATWRDKSNILGFFNEFSKIYSETEFLTWLYDANFGSDEINIYVLDELNISRIEYYFADFLSVLEYPVADWKIKIMNFPKDFLPPLKLIDGYIRIPENSYFVGTANKDDSTFTITDKVYDRAITIDFDAFNEPFTVAEEVNPINLSGTQLRSLYEDAVDNAKNQLDKEDMDNLNNILSFIYDNFGLAIGNRILNQIKNIVPVFIACGGTKEDALDLMLCRKLFAKLEGRFEEYVKPALKDTLSLIEKTYGKGVLKRSEKVINKIIRAL